MATEKTEESPEVKEKVEPAEKKQESKPAEGKPEKARDLLDELATESWF